MIELRLANPGEEAAQKELWKAAFGDSDAYIGAFYDNLYTPERMVLLFDDGVLASMCALLPVTLALPKDKPRKLAYVYALATHPEKRGQGYAKNLLSWADAYLRKHGYDGVCTVPAEESLHVFFAGAGYAEGFVTRALELDAAVLPAADQRDKVLAVQPEQYRAARTALLAALPHAEYGADYLAWQQAVCHLTGGGLYLLNVGGTVGVAVAEYDGDVLDVKELLVTEPLLERAAALLHSALPAARLRLRTPAGGGENWRFGMAKWYAGAPDAPRAYFGLALD